MLTGILKYLLIYKLMCIEIETNLIHKSDTDLDYEYLFYLFNTAYIVH